MLRHTFALALAAALASQAALAEVKLPSIFGSHMVLQQDKPIIIWGSADAGEKVTVTLQQQKQEAIADNAGKWKVTLPAAKAGGPYSLSVAASNTITLEDVLVGEVWVCSGQSNMEMGVKPCLDSEKEIAAADHPTIRLFMIPKTIGAVPADDVKAQWVVCSPTTVAQGGWGGFSAAGYFFGRELEAKLKVPVGLIQTAWGGTRIEPWTTPDAFGALPELKNIHEQVLLADVRSDLHKQKADEFLGQTEAWVASARKAVKEETPLPPMAALPPQLTFNSTSPQTPTGLYNAMIHPIVPFGIRGAIWYQGESNMGEGMLYTRKMQALIQGWRKVWNVGEFPFYFVQIAPYLYGDQIPTILPEFWEAQAAALQQIPNTGMASTLDIGDLKDIHPRNKQEVGRRLALWALAKTYNQPDIIFCGPTFKSLQLDGDKIRITLDNVGGGLASRDGKPLSNFEVIDAQKGGFVPADAVIDGSSIIVSSKEVARPVAVRFAWSKLAEPNLINKEGLPAFPFRAGDVPKRDVLSLIPEMKDYQLVYDLDLAKLGGDIAYTVDNSKTLTGTPERIAYFLELQSPGADNTQYVFASMNAFTTDLTKVGIPTVASSASFQQNVASLNVYSNVPGITQGVGMGGGNIEFWPNNYAEANAAKVPNASAQAFDFGDSKVEPVAGYGSMQVHNYNARQTLFAINNWKAASRSDLGIGNQNAKNLDWTFAANAGNYSSKRLRVFAKMK